MDESPEPARMTTGSLVESSAAVDTPGSWPVTTAAAGVVDPPKSAPGASSNWRLTPNARTPATLMTVARVAKARPSVRRGRFTRVTLRRKGSSIAKQEIVAIAIETATRTIRSDQSSWVAPVPAPVPTSTRPGTGRERRAEPAGPEHDGRQDDDGPVPQVERVGDPAKEAERRKSQCQAGAEPAGAGEDHRRSTERGHQGVGSGIGNAIIE